MQKSYASTIRVLAIITVVLSALGILGCLVGFGLVNAISSYYEPSLYYGGSGSGSHYMYHGGDYYSTYGYGVDQTTLMFMTVFGNLTMVWELIGCVIGLIAGIIAITTFKNPNKLKLAFGWALAGAIMALLTGRIITMVLLILICVFSHKERESARFAAYPSGAAPTSGYAAAYGAAPVAPTAPVAPAVPAAAAPVASSPMPAANPTPITAQPESSATPVYESSVVAKEVVGVPVENVMRGRGANFEVSPAEVPAEAIQETAVVATEIVGTPTEGVLRGRGASREAANAPVAPAFEPVPGITDNK